MIRYRHVRAEWQSGLGEATLNVRGVARPVPLECKKCGKSSNYFVYPDEVCERCWRATLKPISTPAKEHRP